MKKLYWFIVKNEDKPEKICWLTINEPEKRRYSHSYVYIVHRDMIHEEFVYAEKDPAQRCAERLAALYPEEADSIYIRKRVLRTDYK